MKIVLRKDVTDLGEVDSVKDVSEGYARNYLFPRKLAVSATAAEVASVEKRREKREKERSEKKAEFEALAARLSETEVSVSADAGEGGRLFGSITAQDVAEAVKSQLGVEIDKKKIGIEAPIKLLGDYSLPVKLFQEVNATLKVKVVSK